MTTRNLILIGVLGTATSAAAQQPAVTAADYARAERYLGSSMGPLLVGASVRPNWLPDGRVWYRNSLAEGAEFVLVDPADGTRERAFDHARMAAALSAAVGRTFEALELPASAELSEDAGSIVFNIDGRRFRCDVVGTRIQMSHAFERCTEFTPEPQPDAPRNSVVSPDGMKAAFVRDYDLWVSDLATGAETRLTTDGEEDFGYATNNAGWTRSDNPVLLWSPDSRRIATFQHDARGVGMMYLVNTQVGHQELEAWKYPLPEDSVIFRIHRVIIDLEGPRVIRLQMPPDPHRSTLCDHVVCRGGWADVQWFPDGSKLAFVSTTRDHKQATLRVADAATGAVRDVLEERVATQYESGYGRVNWHVLPETNEVIWFSERTNWGNLYMYDLASGELKHPITAGEGPVLEVIHIEPDSRRLLFIAAGREPGRDPYFRHLYGVDFDGSNLELLTPEDANHDVTLSPDASHFTDTYSTPVTPQVTVLRDSEGELRARLEEADISRLREAGWTPPIPFTVKARDGITDLYGLMYRPTTFDSTRSYPVVNYLYPGPQSGSVGSRSFSAARGDKQAIAELGFIVVEVDAMGTPMRSKSFHDAYYGNMGDNGLPDQMGMILQLAERHAWMDTSRVGIYGHSGGGFAAADAILRYPDFYKVAVSQAGNHDNRNYEDDWGERYQGLLVENPDGSTNYDNQANQLLAANLKGRLLLAHGTMDSNVPPNNTLMLVNELIRHNKDFDLILFPNRSHGFGNESYMMRRRWDYFVRHLLGVEPPAGYEIGAGR